PEGLQLARELLRPQLPHDVHDYILEGICKAIDGSNVLAVTRTGSGKTGYFYGYMLLLRAIQTMSPPCALLKRKHPANPATVIVYPTKGLEEEMEKKFRSLDLTALAINEDTLAEARRTKRNLWKECIEKTSIILLSPEQLSSQPFDRLLQNRTFSSRICALGIDEVHLVQDWGDPSFRDAFRHIALVHARMPRGTILIGLTATLLSGKETTALLNTLGLAPGSFFFQRRSNIRRDVQDIYRVLRHGLAGWSFPDLDWIVEGNRKTIIYCNNFALCFRLRTYFHYKAPHKLVRIYNSLCFPSYNADTRRLFVNDQEMQIIIATDSLVVGIDFPNVEDVVDLDCKHPNHGKQRKGRVGREGGTVKDGRGITYITKATMDKAKKMVENQSVIDSGKAVEQGLHIGMAQILVSRCYTEQENILYANPTSDPPCSCKTCENLRKTMPPNDDCICSGPDCCPEPVLPPLPRAHQAQTLPTIPMNLRLTEKMTKLGTCRLQKFREEIWEELSDEIGCLPPLAILPDSSIKNILDNFARIKSTTDLFPYTHDLYLLSGYETHLYAVISELCQSFSALPPPPKRKK
ncbi:P-loop containing nucleoside triphosphate hydrolase protein, partial [Flammula alnicola]